MIIFQLCLGIAMLLVQYTDAYVLLQVRKQDDNHSNIDALIHKVIPSDKFDKFAQKLARKQFKNDDVRSEQMSEENDLRNGAVSLSVDEENPDLMELINLGIKHFVKDGGALLGEKNQEIKPKTIKYRTGESSVLYQINSQSIISGLEELLSSKTVRKYLDKLTRQAAVVYRSMKQPRQ